MNDKLQKVISDLAQTKQDLQNFRGKTDHLADSQLPSLKEGFGAEDIFSFGGTALMKKKMNELIDQVVDYIKQRRNLLDDFQHQLDGFQAKASDIAMLGDLVNFYKQKAILLMTVYVFHAPPNLDITQDDTLNQINSIIQNIGMIVSLALDVAGFPEIGMALQAILLVIGAIFSMIEIIQKTNSIVDCFNKLRPAYDRIAFSDQQIHESSSRIDQTFVDLHKFLVDIGNTKVDENPKNIIAEMVAVQTAFNNVYTDYEKLKDVMKSNPTVFDALATTYKNQVGYGDVNKYTFFLVLYAEENLKPNEVADFLTKHGSQVPAGGVDKLVKIVEYISTTFQTDPVNVALVTKLSANFANIARAM